MLWKEKWFSVDCIIMKFFTLSFVFFKIIGDIFILQFEQNKMVFSICNEFLCRKEVSGLHLCVCKVRLFMQSCKKWFYTQHDQKFLILIY